MTHKEPNQKLYDAMLIRAFRRLMPTKAFKRWVMDTFGMWPNELPLKRCAGWMGHSTVRGYVGTFLRPLADRLWDTTPDKDIETLQLLQGKWSALDCERRVQREHAKAQRKTHEDDTRRAAVATVLKARFEPYRMRDKGSSTIKVRTFRGRSR